MASYYIVLSLHILGATVWAGGHLVLAVTIPLSRRSAFYKIGKRDAVAISLVMAAASVDVDGRVAIGLGCVAPVPWRARAAETLLAAHGLHAASIDAAAALVATLRVGGRGGRQ